MPWRSGEHRSPVSNPGSCCVGVHVGELLVAEIKDAALRLGESLAAIVTAYCVRQQGALSRVENFSAAGRARRPFPKGQAIEVVPQARIYVSEADPNGWVRLQWLAAPRPSLSELALADEAASDGAAKDTANLSGDGRTLADVFKSDSLAVVALARSDVAWISSSTAPHRRRLPHDGAGGN